MFNDSYWNEGRDAEQWKRRGEFFQGLKKPNIVVIEIGAGTYVPSVRMESENVAAKYDGTLVRINIRDYDCQSPTVSQFIPITLGGKEALTQIEQQLKQMGFFTK